MLNCLVDNPQIVAAASTVLLAVFAAVQIGIELSRKADLRRASASKAVGPAWLARRNCEAVLTNAVGQQTAYTWWETASSRGTLNKLQDNMLDMLGHAADAGGGTARAARAAYAHFLAFADIVNDSNSFRATGVDARGGVRPTADERIAANAAAKDAINHLFLAVEELENLASRHAHEAPVMDKQQMPLLADKTPRALSEQTNNQPPETAV